MFRRLKKKFKFKSKNKTTAQHDIETVVGPSTIHSSTHIPDRDAPTVNPPPSVPPINLAISSDPAPDSLTILSERRVDDSTTKATAVPPTLPGSSGFPSQSSISLPPVPGGPPLQSGAVSHSNTVSAEPDSSTELTESKDGRSGAKTGQPLVTASTSDGFEVSPTLPISSTPTPQLSTSPPQASLPVVPPHQLLSPSPNESFPLLAASTSPIQSDSSTLRPSDHSAGQPPTTSSTTSFFQSAHDFSITGGTFTSLQGNLIVNNYNSADPSRPIEPELPIWIKNVLRVGAALSKSLVLFTGAPAVSPFVELSTPKERTGKGTLEYCCDKLINLVAPLIEEGYPKVSPELKESLEALHSKLSGMYEEICRGEDNESFVGNMSNRITQEVDSFVLLNCISETIKSADSIDNVGMQILRQIIRDLPRVEAAYNDYATTKKAGLCFEGTREAILREIAEWVCTPNNPQVYLLSGMAGIGKSTIAYTIAERAQRCGYLGASFFFSRDEDERSNAKKFITTVAYQLCLYNEDFARMIEGALETKEGADAITKSPLAQLEALILKPLRGAPQSYSSPVVVVVDALDECIDQDGPIILVAMDRLVQALPHFKVIVTTRPHPHLPLNLFSHKVFHLQNIDEKIVNSDIKRYLENSLSRELVIATLPTLEDVWSANGEDVESLVESAGRLFIMASTAVRFILDTTAHDPRSQMEVLKTSGRVSLDSLEDFYNIILRRAVPPKQPRMVQRFKDIIGMMVVAKEPLSLTMLERFTQPWPLNAIRALLANLRSVIVLNDSDEGHQPTPRFYHKSFFDFITDPLHCAEDFLIDPKLHHTRAAISCFRIMNMGLKQNILNLGTPARFMNNDAGLAAENISHERLAQMIPSILQYACAYWADHVEGADTNDSQLMEEAETFVKKHLLHWFETVSWLGKVWIATRALRIISKLVGSTSDTGRIIYDALRFVGKFWRCFGQSALHVYYSSLPFSPTGSLLYKAYQNEMTHGLCRLDRVGAHWDAQIAYFYSADGAYNFVFSNDSSKYASKLFRSTEIKIWDAENGTPLLTFYGKRWAIASDFSIVAISTGAIVELWGVADDLDVPVATFTHSQEVIWLALSFDGARLAVGCDDDTITLWDAKKDKSIASLAVDWKDYEFASSLDYRLASQSADGAIQLWDGNSGELIARLDYASKKHSHFVISRDGNRLASLVHENDGYSLTLWDAKNGDLLGVADGAGKTLRISEDGSLILTAAGEMVQLWSGRPLSLTSTISIGGTLSELTLSRGIIAVGRGFEGVELYDANTRATIAKTDRSCFGVELSPDGTRLASGGRQSFLFDIQSLKEAFSQPPRRDQEERSISAFAFSPSSLQHASGFEDGTVELWSVEDAESPLSSHKLHSGPISALEFSLGGERFSSASADKVVRFWDGRDGAPVGHLEHPFTGALSSMAFSDDLLAVATESNISLFEHESHRFIGSLDGGSHSMSFLHDNSLLASAHKKDSTSYVTVWNAEERVAIATFTVEYMTIDRFIFSPDGSQLAVQVIEGSWGDYSRNGSLKFFDIKNKNAYELTGQEDISWLPNVINGVLMSLKWDRGAGHHLTGQFPGRNDQIPVLRFPADLHIDDIVFRSSTAALRLARGRILFLRFPMSFN